LLVTIIFVMMNCKPAEKPLTADEKTRIETEISGLMDTLVQESKDLDYDKTLSHYLTDVNFSLIMDGQPFIGGDTIIKMMNESKGFIKEYISFDLIERHVIVLDKDLALSITPYTEAYITSVGDTSAVKGTITFLFRNKDGEWKVIHGNIIHGALE
jgi:ketosteroid isomerase-like protein